MLESSSIAYAPAWRFETGRHASPALTNRPTRRTREGELLYFPPRAVWSRQRTATARTGPSIRFLTRARFSQSRRLAAKNSEASCLASDRSARRRVTSPASAGFFFARATVRSIIGPVFCAGTKPVSQSLESSAFFTTGERAVLLQIRNTLNRHRIAVHAYVTCFGRSAEKEPNEPLR